MAFELGIPLSKSIEEQLTATLREKLPSLEEFSNEEVVRRGEAADVFGAVGAIRGIPILHNLSGLGDQDLVEAFDIDALRRERTVPLARHENQMTVAISNPYGDFKVLYEKRFPGIELSLVLTHAAQITAVLTQNQRIQQITQDEIRQLDVDDVRDEVKDFDLNSPSDDSVVRNLQAIVLEGINRRASDIHLLTEKDRFHYTYRLEGELVERRDLDLKLMGRTDNLLTHLMGVEAMDKNKGFPLSGRFTVKIGDRATALRSKRLPSYRGFHYTLRILDKSHVSAKLGQGSLAPHPVTMKYIKQALNLPDGMI